MGDYTSLAEPVNEIARERGNRDHNYCLGRFFTFSGR
jgi:hypothetical protein